MVPIDLTNIRELTEAVIAAFSALGGAMAYASGSYAAEALAEKQPAYVVARRVNEGVGRGFMASRWLLTAVFVVMVFG